MIAGSLIFFERLFHIESRVVSSQIEITIWYLFLMQSIAILLNFDGIIIYLAFKISNSFINKSTELIILVAYVSPVEKSI